jgi:dipeptidyl-peptidase 4
MMRAVSLLPLISVIALAAGAQPAPNQQQMPQGAPRTLRQLTLEDIFDPKAKVSFSGSPQSGFLWLDDERFTWPRTDASGTVTQQVVFDTKSGKESPLFDPARLERAIAAVGGVRPDEIQKLARPKTWNLSPNHRAALLELGKHLYLYNFGSETVSRLTSGGDSETEASFSPDGKVVAFVRNNNLFVIDLESGMERQLATDGSPNILNGILDWVYQEEIYGRGNFHAYWWSPDSSTIAYLQLNEDPVQRFTVVDHIPTMQELEVTPYPKAGYANPVARLFVVPVAGGAAKPVDMSAYRDLLVVDATWRPDSKALVYQIQDREQTWLDLNSFDLASGVARTLLRERTKAWVDHNGNPEWLKDGSFLWLSERTGFKHIYHYDGSGGLLRQVTSGRWEVRTLHGVDPANRWIYFSGTERSVLGGDAYRVRLDGSGLVRLTDRPGTHKVGFNPSFSQFVDSWSDIQTPPQVSLFRSDGSRVRVVDANEPSILRGYRLSRPEFVQVPTRDGFVMEAMLIKPPDFDPAKKYPVYEHTYSGPHSQQVRNEWTRGNTTFLFHQLLAQKGIVVWVCDNRSASGKGIESAWPIYKNFGELELRDLEDGMRWLESQPGIDSSHTLLNGWSYGGFMTSYAMTHSKMWAAGISGGTVADWRAYDTVYTERYMLTPEHNEEGYRKSSPRWSAAGLSGKLLLLHGAIDDNVHLQNTVQFVYELEKAGKLFDLMIYPESRHSVTDPVLVKHLHDEQMHFIEENLLR